MGIIGSGGGGLFLLLGSHLKSKQMVKRVKNIYRKLGSWAWGCGSWLRAVDRGCSQAGSGIPGVKLLRSYGSRKTVAVSYGAGKERVKQDRMIGVDAVLLLSWGLRVTFIL